MKYYIKEMRPHHWIKNILVFAALACSGHLFSASGVIKGLWGFAAFCFISSAVYFINDIRDVEKDRKHPEKCKRPIASGKIPVRNACITAGFLFLLAALCNLMVFEPVASVIIAVYFLLNLGYSLGLKNVPLLDVTILVSGFIFRILYGAIITNIEISNWLYLTVIAAAFYFSLGKRRNELKRTSPGNTRTVLNYYSEGFLDKNMYMCLALTNIFYALWSMDEKTVEAYGSRCLIWTVPIVLVICMKYSLDVEGDSDGDPVEVVIHDKVLSVLCIAYLALMLAILYF